MSILLFSFLVFCTLVCCKTKSFEKANHKEPKQTRTLTSGEIVVALKKGVSVEQFAESTGLIFVRKLKTNLPRYLFKHQNSRVGRSIFESVDKDALDEYTSGYEENAFLASYVKDFAPDDPLYAEQFHLENTGQFDGVKGVDINVKPVWEEENFGDGIKVVIVDDSLLKDHADIQPNFQSEGSWDYCLKVSDPSGESSNYHGTACAGLASGAANNGLCGIGVAPKSKIVGRRLICSGATNADYAEAMSDESQTRIDISSNSWGPKGCDSEYCTFYDYSTTVYDAIIDGTINGRDGKGIVYVFAAGNEGQWGGDVNQYDYAKILQVISVASVDNTGSHPKYSNRGTSILVSSVSSGDLAKIRTIGSASNEECLSSFTGTSAATPMVAGVVALLLSKYPDLSFWDVQALLIESATVIDYDLYDTDGWITNGADYKYHTHYGFGLVDAGSLLTMAKDWQNLEDFGSYDSNTISVNLPIPDDDEEGISSTFEVSEDNSLTLIGGVIIHLTVKHERIGDIQVQLTSPEGTTAQVIEKTTNFEQTSFSNYYLSVKSFYSEKSKGTWKITIIDDYELDKGNFTNWSISFYGIKGEKPTTPTKPNRQINSSNTIILNWSFFIIQLILFSIYLLS
ncbi:neuroendocrine convertase 1 [Anaeramoeba flamelloides]|uniref:Neuroendocrine convertase 1 n=1 Tax=Anaeramoeba flamelloides TaxID=1746091 RepID=A0ABQ8XCC2_9EUKA|nr:neuroendocrine convertase 1 [Anaeramoeba flamelloides]